MKNMVALFLMNEDEKINYFRDYLSVWSSNYDSYLVKFNALYEESLKYKDSAKSKYLDYCERLHTIFLLIIFIIRRAMRLNFIFLHFSLLISKLHKLFTYVVMPVMAGWCLTR